MIHINLKKPFLNADSKNHMWRNLCYEINKLSILGSLLLSIHMWILTSCDTSYDSPMIADDAISIESPKALQFNNYLGNSMNIHPKVLYFPEGWNGYKFWMAYTPYPKGRTSVENPSIAVSNDGINWELPGNFFNPLIGKPVRGYNSDTHLVYNEAKNTLECWWREAYESIKVDRIMRTTTKDGVIWTTPEEMYSDGKNMNHLSPSISIIDGEYHMFYCDAKNIVMMKSPYSDHPTEWSEDKTLPVAWDGLLPWHMDMIIGDDGCAEIIVCAYTPGESNNSADLYYLTYDLLKNESCEPRLILSRSENSRDIHSRSIYRSSILRIDGIYYIYFSCISDSWKRHISLAYGEEITSLRFHPLNHPVASE